MIGSRCVLQLDDDAAQQQFSPTAEGVLLIGSDRHCQCRLPASPRVAAVIVQFADAWMLFDLGATALQINGKPFSRAVELRDGDILQVASAALRILGVGGSGRQEAAADRQPSVCSVRCTAADGLTLSHDTRTIALVGTAQICDIVLPASSRLKSRHCLVVPRGERWFVVNLTGGLGQHTGGRKWTDVVEVRQNDVVQLGHLRMSFGIRGQVQQTETRSGVGGGDTDPGQSQIRPVPEVVPEVTAGAAAQHSAAAEGLPSSAAVVAPGSETAALHAMPEVQETPQDAGVFIIDPELSAAAQDVFNTIRAGQLTVQRTTGVFDKVISGLRLAGRLADAEQHFIEGRRLLAFSRLKTLLAENPWNRSVLLSFARMCDCCRLFNLCFQTLHLVHRQLPDDVVVLKSMARVSLQLARTEPRYYDLCLKYWARVQVKCPQEQNEIRTTLRNVSAEKTIAYRFFEKL